MAKQRKTRDASTTFALWKLERETERAAFRGERRWWKWSIHKSSVFVLAYLFIAGLPLFLGFALMNDAVFRWDGETVVRWGKLLQGAGVVMVALAILAWFSTRKPRLWEARPGLLCIDGQSLLSGQVQVLLHEMKEYQDEASDMGVTGRSRMLHAYLVLQDGSEQHLAGFGELGSDAAIEALETLGSTAGVAVASRAEWEQGEAFSD